MPRVVGVDAGTVSLDLVGLDAGRVFLEHSLPTAEALADPSVVVGLLEAAAPLDLIVAPSGYGLSLVSAQRATEADLALAFLARRGETGGIGGLKALIRTLARLPCPVMLTPGVIHLESVPVHRKINRIDMGTADKLCAVVLAIAERAAVLSCPPGDVSCVLLELGGAFSAAIAVERGQIVDGLGGTSGPMGARAAGALDGEVAWLVGRISKDLLFRGGAEDAGEAGWRAFRESALKALAALSVSAPAARDIVLSGRHAAQIGAGLAEQLQRPVFRLGMGVAAKQGAHGAALLADGLAGGAAHPIVERLGIARASGTVLDHLCVITPDAARARLGIGA